MEEEGKQVRFAVAAFNDLNSMATAETALRQIDQGPFETALFAERSSLTSQLTSSIETKTSGGSLAGKAAQQRSEIKQESPRDGLSYDDNVMIEAGMSTRSRPRDDLL